MRVTAIKNGLIADPLNGERLICRDVFISDGKISKTPSPANHVIDAKGLIVMAGGIDVHTHVTGALPRNGDEPDSAEIKSIGLRYAELGYTTIIDPAVPLTRSTLATKELGMIPQVDKGFLVMLGAWEPVLRLVENGDEKALARLVSWLADKAGAYSLKLVNPGGGFLKQTAGPSVETRLDGFAITSVDVARAVARAVEESGLPCPLQLHLNDLGEPYSHVSAIKTIDGLSGAEAHLAHLQFHCYGGRGGFSSEARAVADAVNANPNVTADIGQIVFGETLTVTADTRLGEKLKRLSCGSGRRHDTGFGDGCYCVPYDYREDSAVNAVQWACGLELALSIEDPARIFISTDHPNGGPFTAYPNIIRSLMDKPFRDGVLDRIHPAARERTGLGSIHRTLDVYDIVSMTRAGPAKFLGIADRKGGLKPGSDADIAIYRPNDNVEEMFAKPAWVIKSGEVIVKDGVTVAEVSGEILRYQRPLNTDNPPQDVVEWIERREKG